MNDLASNSKSNIFRHGAIWVRADFHLHTIKEMGASRKAFRQEFAGRENEFAAAFIGRLKEEKIGVGVITNHNLFDIGEYQDLARKARNEGILLLPGIELGIRGGGSSIHALIVFDPDALNEGNNFIENFLRGQFPRGNSKEGDATEDDLVGCLKKLESLGVAYFIVFAHVDSSNGLLEVVNKTELDPIFQQTREIWINRVLGFQKVKQKEAWIEQKLPNDIPIPAFLEGSDPQNSVKEIGRTDQGVCFLKLSELSYHAVRFALRDHILRVRREKLPASNRPKIQSVEIEGGKRSYAAYFLSENLNSLIGSRGSGKSLMIEALRWCLNVHVGEGDRNYKEELIHAFLDRGATVKVKGTTAEGKSFEISRSYTAKKEQPEPQVAIEGEKLNIRVDAILPGVLYFGQKDLGERDKESTENIFEQLLSPVPESLLSKSAAAKSEFEKAIDIYVIAKQAEAKDDELKFEEQNLDGKLETFKELGVEGQLKEITSFDQDLRRLRALYKSLQEEQKALSGAFRAEEDLLSWEDVLQSELNKELKPELAALRVVYGAARSNISGGILSLKKVEEGITELGKRLDAKMKEKQESFAHILREVNQPDLDIDGYRKMVSRLEQIRETRKKTAEKKGKLNFFEKNLIDSGKTWHASLEEITNFHRSEIEKINLRLPENINIHQKFQADKLSFREFLDGIFKGTGFNEPSYEAIVSSVHHGLDLFARRKQILDTELKGEAMKQKFSAQIEKHFKTVLTFSSPDERLIQYEGTEISELSLGKRAMALLLLLLSLDSHPIIILDQPEDDLDNETIHNFIVKPLVENKNRIQFIIASHNPNIPVLGDAEQVIACYEKKRSDYSEEFGSLDMQKTKDAIIDIMEGGRQAFEKRHDIYTLWAKPS